MEKEKFMKKSIYKIVFMTFFVLLNLTSLSAKNRSVDTITDLAQQRAELHKMLEMYALVGTNIAFNDPKQTLKNSINDYEVFIRTLQKSRMLKKSQKLWMPIKKRLLGALKSANQQKMKKNAVYLYKYIPLLVKELLHIQQTLIKKLHIKNKKILNASIDIEVSSKRLCSNYVMKVWNIEGLAVQKEWNEEMKRYKNASFLLKKSSFYKHKKFKKLLDETIKYHTYFKMISRFKTKYVPTLIDEKTTLVFNNALKMTQIILSQTKQ